MTPSQNPDLWFHFVRTHRRMIREIEHRLAQQQLPSYAWYDALWGIESGNNGERRMHELADVMAIERYNLTRLIDRLQKEDLVQRIKTSEDGRGAIARITDKGKALRQRMWQVYKTTVQELFLIEFNQEQQNTFAQILKEISQNARDQQESRIKQ